MYSYTYLYSEDIYLLQIIVVYRIFETEILNSFVIVCYLNVRITSITWITLIPCNSPYLITESEALIAPAWLSRLKAWQSRLKAWQSRLKAWHET